MTKAAQPKTPRRNSKTSVDHPRSMLMNYTRVAGDCEVFLLVAAPSPQRKDDL